MAKKKKIVSDTDRAYEVNRKIRRDWGAISPRYENHSEQEEEPED